MGHPVIIAPVKFFLAMGADDGLIGMNGCLLTYDPQIYRYTGKGQIVSQDFCFTIEEMKPGSIVSFDTFLLFNFKILYLALFFIRNFQLII